MKYCVTVMLCLMQYIKLCHFAYIDYFNTIEENVRVACETNEHCIDEGFICVNNLCVCQNTYCKKSKVTQIITRIGVDCPLFSKCTIENSYCSNQGKCDCINKTISSKDGRQCFHVTEALNLPCKENIQCRKLNAKCINDKCTCGSGMHSINGKCFQSIGLGLICTIDEECQITDFSNCKDYICMCENEYISNHNNSKCLLKAKNISSSCLEDVQCSSTLGFGSRCYNELCTCMDLYNYKKSLNQCVQDSLLGSECGKHDDCHQPGSDESRLECIIGVCQCKPSYEEKYGYCIQNSHCCSFSQLNRLTIMAPFIFSYAFLLTIR